MDFHVGEAKRTTLRPAICRPSTTASASDAGMALVGVRLAWEYDRKGSARKILLVFKS
jgi:hypothetical protein